MVYLGANKISNKWLGTNLLDTKVYPAAEVQSFLLDTYPAIAAYSASRKLKTGQQYAMRVRRASDNTETDIGFVANGDTDESAIASFCGASDGFVPLLVDATGNGHDATQIVAMKQPKIYDGGTGLVVTENNKLALKFNDSHNFVTILSTQTQPNSVFAVARLDVTDTSSTRMIMDGSTDSSRNVLYYGAGVGTFNIFSSIALGIKAVDTNQNLWSVVFNGVNSSGQINAGTTIIGNTGGNIMSNFNIGMAVTNNLFWIGTIQELIIYNSDQSTNKTNIKADINNYFSIY